jgi:hypothetical protein
VTIPAEHPGNMTLHPVVYATQSGTSGGATIVNLQMQKTLSIAILPNPETSFRTAEMRSFKHQVMFGESAVEFPIDSVSEISEFAFDEQGKKISFKVSGLAGSGGSVTVPVSKLLVGPYNVMIDDNPVLDYEMLEEESLSQTSLKISHTHSAHSITITGTSVVPEFSIPILLAGVIVTVTIARRVLKNG